MILHSLPGDKAPPDSAPDGLYAAGTFLFLIPLLSWSS